MVGPGRPEGTDGSGKEGASKKVTELSRSDLWANKKMNQTRQD